MRLLSYSVAILLAATAGGAACAQEAATATAPAAAPSAAPAVTKGSTLRAADGKKLGKIDRVNVGGDGTVQSVALIHDGRYVYVPGNTLTASESGVTTSLSRAEVRKLK